MDLRPGFKQTEVGVIPDDWIVKSVACMGEVVAGKSLAVHAPGCQRPYLRTKNVFDGRIDITDVLTMPMTDQEFNRFMIRPGDVLLNEGQSLELVGRCALYQGEYPAPCAMQNQLLRFRARNGVSAGFAAHLFRRSQQTGVFARVALKTTSVAHLGSTRFEKLKLAWPKTEREQNAIADALSDIDELLDGLGRLIAKKRDLKQAAMQQLFVGRTRLPGFSRQWETKRLGDIAEIVMGHSPSSSSYNVIGAGLPLIQGNADIENRQTIRRVFTTQITRRGNEGDLLMSVRAPVGEVSRAVFDACLGRGVCAIRFPNDFLYHCLIHLEPTWAKHSRGSTFDAVNAADVEAFEVDLPSDPDEQQAIATVLADMDAEIDALEQRRAKTADLKHAMMQELLTGRIRIKVVEPMVPSKEKTFAVLPTTTAKKPHNWQINEAVIIGVLARQFGSQAWPLPRKRRVKLTYLLHRHCEGTAEGYLKKAAGPYDPRTKYQGPEKIAAQNKYVAAHHNGKYEGFIGGTNIEQAVGYFEKWYGAEPLNWIEQFHYEKTDELELLATVDMAMVELASKRQSADVEGVKSVISAHPEWEAKLERDIFSDLNIARAIERCAALFSRDRGSHA